ncbi:uncharacterized protein LOC126686686 isoform X2 [Mercurialis annua]|uniref:uncharacterized protein LOC126686686 isoform X2 n=1 Tax=Mercurialis annua TaxID=3986 RepID=UPI00215FD2E4|nr:uncharacterized protein LOC126686686 isoform X2 [Mercurialis annua]
MSTLPIHNTTTIITSSIINATPRIFTIPIHFRFSPSTNSKRLRFPFRTAPKIHSSHSNPQEDGEIVETLRVPDHWLLPPTALQESEWLRVTLHKWLDDEYCPEETNVEISNVAAMSYYESLVMKRTELGEILLLMARDLESISYQESFHGAFSSANAAIYLISQRIELLQVFWFARLFRM